MPNARRNIWAPHPKPWAEPSDDFGMPFSIGTLTEHRLCQDLKKEQCVGLLAFALEAANNWAALRLVGPEILLTPTTHWSARKRCVSKVFPPLVNDQLNVSPSGPKQKTNFAVLWKQFGYSVVTTIRWAVRSSHRYRTLPAYMSDTTVVTSCQQPSSLTSGALVC